MKQTRGESGATQGAVIGDEEQVEKSGAVAKSELLQGVEAAEAR